MPVNVLLHVINNWLYRDMMTLHAQTVQLERRFTLIVIYDYNYEL